MSSPAAIFVGAGARAGAALPFHLTRISPTPSALFTTLKAPTFTSLRRGTHLRIQPASVRDSVDELGEELELREKPSPPTPPPPPPEAEVEGEEEVEEAQGEQQLGPNEVLAPFLKFFKGKDGSDGGDGELSSAETEEERLKGKVLVEYYEPVPGDIVVGVVVSGNENKLDVNVGADLLGTMLTKEVMPLYGQELPYLQCDLSKDAEDFMVPGKIGIVKDDEAFDRQYVHGRPVVEVGTILFAEVLGRTLSGRPLLSTRRLFRRVAWHRVRQINQLNEPIEVKITEWNTGGLLTRIEGLRAFLPKVELMNRAKSFSALKENVGRKITVMITRVDESKNDLIISERQAWDKLHLEEGTLLEGTVLKIFPYGAQVRIGDSNRSGLLHVSNISRARVTDVSEVLSEDDKVKVLVVRSMFPERISLSIADLESEPGLFLSNKEKVFSEAQEMARRYRQKLPTVAAARKLEPIPSDGLFFHDDAKFYANWHWFRFEEIQEPNVS